MVIILDNVQDVEVLNGIDISQQAGQLVWMLI